MASDGASPNAGQLAGKIAMVTGASSGIGAGIAKSLAAAGARVILCARRVDRLEALKAELPDGSLALKMDVSNRVDVQETIVRVEQEIGPIDILVNNAGVMYFTLMKNAHLDEWEQTVDVCCKGMMFCTGAIYPGMVTRGSGHIVNITSDAARSVFPALAVYCAAKSFCSMFSKSLRAESVGTGIRVTEIQPGDVATDLVMRNTDQEAADKVGAKIGEMVGTGSDRNGVLDVDDVAKAVLYAVTAPPHVGVNEILIEPRDQQ
eukprot:TRINITY_DN3954_c0_g1_i10.p1 TRINITY_DN3954_c0_g1~~TRINITY_DN3954_c0_g1_i10.p1  ORF type:complete len:262 (+),score=46.19 TRINITY_DN3954_c0_g1_i10:69-854(+)